MAPVQILIVEDEGITALSLRRKLERLGYEVAAVVASGEDAITCVNADQPDLILMDIMLDGELDGIEAAGRIRGKFDIPVIYLTANSDESTLQRAKQTEPFGYLLKPFEERELYTNIEMALSKHALERRIRESQHWLATMLDSIGDAVIATGPDGRIKLMNPAAEALTGWSEQAASQADLDSVFAIFDEAGTSIENPLARSLRDMARVAIDGASLTVKHGRPIPIDVNASPIQDDQGTLLGGVLVFRDITQRRQARAALKSSNEQLEAMVTERTQELTRSNAELEQFAYVVSHDLREPLRIMQGYAELLSRRYRSQLDERGDKFIDFIVDGATRMHALINDLLTYSRVGAGDLETEPIDLNRVLERVLRDLAPAIQESDADISAGQLPTVRVNAIQIAQVFQNLISNAIKFRGVTPPQIAISAALGDGEWTFCVRDNGIGIEPQYREQIFDMFGRLHSQADYPGTGIGLAVCKKIIERHDGRMWLSDHVGLGSEFCFSLPEHPQLSD